ncbi:MAG: DeoR/GlpR family DNA-binding transcription regulator [Paracoccaceae bacterium]
MLTSQRKSLLLDRLARDGRLVASDLATDLGVSEDTIRRDLRDLAADGRLVRVHGGALPASPTHRPFEARRTLQAAAKQRLGLAAAGLIRPGQVVIIDGGTTHLALIAALPRDLNCTIVTHAPAIAAALEAHEQIDVILIGGRMFRHSMVACGATTERAFQSLRADLCLLGVTGVHPETGLTTGDAEEAALKATLIDVSAEVAVLATPDKLGATSPWIIAPLTAMTTLISPAERPDWLPKGILHLAAGTD